MESKKLSDKGVVGIAALFDTLNIITIQCCLRNGIIKRVTLACFYKAICPAIANRWTTQHTTVIKLNMKRMSNNIHTFQITDHIFVSVDISLGEFKGWIQNLISLKISKYIALKYSNSQILRSSENGEILKMTGT